MTRSAARKGHRTKAARSDANDKAIYLSFIIIGIAVAGLAFLFSPPNWGAVTLGYLAAVAWLVNLYAYRIYRGEHLAGWQCALARLPLRCAGFGRRHGKPVEAAHDVPKARSMILTSIAVSVAAIVLLSFVLIPGLRAW